MSISQPTSRTRSLTLLRATSPFRVARHAWPASRLIPRAHLLLDGALEEAAQLCVQLLFYGSSAAEQSALASADNVA